ncbi:MAG: SDR family oxidoreductase [Rhodospirillaceae bacterium]|jgi:NAD(P)-dependent dehydrogenase (short-subunit alcohol dehydrogenase family)|nr:SDR family oxidoreductase [Rhodospirillaceae bacterium]MBT5241453.1 SDR family oxidoreductase [Rhodospirillaceae bacterium]MBT5566277.1 SDR family oxidoreductase [Rhodospirillaceae bacterium]MBT6089058.1 SDR family oxidoreductase [Rhodospirillaceae bacterium]
MISCIPRLRRLAVTLVVLAVASGASTSMSANAGTVLITGANRGIGLEFVRHYADAGYTVIATARNPSTADDLNSLAAANKSIHVEELDVNDFAEIDGLAEKYQGTAIDVLVNNAGITGRPERQRFGTIDYATFASVMSTNAQGPLKITEAFTAHVASSDEKKVAVVTSSEGSIAGATSNRQPFYRASKAAVNMIMRNISHSLKDQGIVVVLVNPGPVDTDMMARARGRMPLRTTTLAVDEMVTVIDNATLNDTATFYNFDGTVLPW